MPSIPIASNLTWTYRTEKRTTLNTPPWQPWVPKYLWNFKQQFKSLEIPQFEFDHQDYMYLYMLLHIRIHNDRSVNRSIPHSHNPTHFPININAQYEHSRISYYLPVPTQFFKHVNEILDILPFRSFFMKNRKLNNPKSWYHDYLTIWPAKIKFPNNICVNSGSSWHHWIYYQYNS